VDLESFLSSAQYQDALKKKLDLRRAEAIKHAFKRRYARTQGSEAAG
jgi:hypothetical protein